MEQQEKLKSYWKENVKYLLILISIWFIVGYILPIFMYGILDQKFVFWMAQQGAIYAFVILIFVYVYIMNKLDAKYDLEE